MSGTMCLAKRNVICFFRDRSSVAFSLMAVFILVALYLLFLRGNLLDSYPGMENLIDAWVMAGIVAIIPVTASAGCLQTMVQDKADGRIRDIEVTPMRPEEIVAGYMLSTFAVCFIMSAVSLAISLAYLLAVGCPLSASGALISAALLVPSSLSGAIIVYALTSFIRSPGAFSGFFVAISVLIGFLAGIYMPMGTMPDAMRIVGTLVPATHMAAMFRCGLAGDALEAQFAGAPSEAISEFRLDMGFDLSLGGFEFDALSSLAYVFAVSLAFFILSAIAVRGIRSRGRIRWNV
ncbi:MAG: ABC transporter permease [Candidatus Methanomethylophilaceae archaeon]|nr:ABC transporter permease [Candidatus Methanomethylophilaceae archaeon]